MALARILVMIASVWMPQPAVDPAPTCHEWHECERLARDAYARGEYERFHDLAWRTLQTGPTRNPELMYLLARAQSLSGRPHDALIMLGRLAEMGFRSDAASDDDFRAVRQLRQWAEPAATMTAATPTPNIPSPAAAAPPAAEETLRISAIVLGAAGVAHDRASSRFVVVDTSLRKLIIIDERSSHVVDLVTSASAGFYDITGLEIDPVRGDLWVVSSEPASATTSDHSPASALHKLQLVSGRPLERIPCPVDLQPCRFQDVGIARDGRVIVLDTAGNRLLRWFPANRTFTAVAALHVAATSLAPAGERFVYVAHEDGIARVDTSTGAVTPLAYSRDVQLAGFERIRWARDSLVGVQRLPDGSQRAVRLKIVAGRAASIEIIDGGIAATDNLLATASGDEFYVLVHPRGRDVGDVVIRRRVLR
jgi:hypothetical protein